ncbi:alpha/beta fold hydrolase [Vulgatibacter incomptus]|uniref:Tripeptidylaminopeptidase n=1 Tax=Vulgatibacter incomptus TaxID=1391653 RepID=A0A0K1PBE1_9BACT|nr:alpha/beta fold hydrolase [Vulgatibacter incomptus]AKU90716.1 Tripeptidylaminopeptidase precursor [Vulgatibacter incomptus]
MSWEPCDDFGVRMDCATLDVPLDWSKPEGRRIPYFVRRVPSATGVPKRGQIWLLVGGPGYAGEWTLDLAPTFASLGFDSYAPDYRGVGRSAPLGCEGEPPSNSEVTSTCLAELAQEWGDGLAQFSTTGAALDLGNAIEWLREPGKQVVVLGTSYGTFLGNRYLHLFPTQADAAIFGGICPGNACSVHQDRATDLIAKETFRLCAADSFCRSKLSDDPWGKLEELYQKVRSGHCDQLAGWQTERLISNLFVSVLGERSLAPVALAMAYRIDRCDPADVSAVMTLARLAMPWLFAVTTDEAPYSAYLRRQITNSEFWEDGLTPEMLRDEVLDHLVAPGLGYAFAEWYETWPWPLYSTPAELKRWAPVSIPMLLINGTLDLPTPLADIAGIEAAYPGPAQTFVRVPNEGHGAMDTACPMSIVRAFVQDPSARPDLSCLARMETIDLRGTSSIARQVFGTTDMWENSGASAAPTFLPDEPTDPGLLRAIERAKDGPRPRW